MCKVVTVFKNVSSSYHCPCTVILACSVHNNSSKYSNNINRYKFSHYIGTDNYFITFSSIYGSYQLSSIGKTAEDQPKEFD